MGKNARHYEVDPSRQVSRHIRDALTSTQLNIGRRKINGMAAQLGHAGFKCHPGAQRWFLKYHSQGFTPEPFLFFALFQGGLQLFGEFEYLVDLAFVEIKHRRKVSLHVSSVFHSIAAIDNG